MRGDKKRLRAIVPENRAEKRGSDMEKLYSIGDIASEIGWIAQRVRYQVRTRMPHIEAIKIGEKRDVYTRCQVGAILRLLLAEPQAQVEAIEKAIAKLSL